MRFISRGHFGWLCWAAWLSCVWPCKLLAAPNSPPAGYTLTAIGAGYSSGIVQMGFKPGDPTKLYVARGDGVYRYDYAAANGALSNQVMVAQPGSGNTIGGFAFHGNDLYASYWTNAGNWNLTTNNGIAKYTDSSSDGDYLDTGERTTIVSGIEIISNVHQLNQLQVHGNSLFIGIGTKNNEGFNNRTPFNSIFNETTYNGTISYIADLTAPTPSLEIWANGLRNPFGVRVDYSGTVWASDNGASARTQGGSAGGGATATYSFPATNDLFYKNLQLGDRGIFPPPPGAAPLDYPASPAATNTPLAIAGNGNAAPTGFDFIPGGADAGQVLVSRWGQNGSLANGHDLVLINRDTGAVSPFVSFNNTSDSPIEVIRDPHGRMLVGMNSKDAGTSSIYLLATSALLWDSNIDAAGPQGGTGIWDATTTSSWWNGSANQQWGNGTTNDATFAGTAGTVTINGQLTVNDLSFVTPGYTLAMNNTDRLTVSGVFYADVPVTLSMNVTGIPANNFADATHWQRGLQFNSSKTLGPEVTIRVAGSNQWAIVGMSGAGNVLEFAGSWEGAPSGSENNRVALAGGAKLLVKEGARINNNQPDGINARRWDIASDCHDVGGVRNVVEFEVGFDADISHNYALADGLSTFRMGQNVTWITNHTRNLPSIYKKGSGGTFDTHHGLISFDAGITGQKWIVQTNDQLFDGQMGFAVDWTLETQTDLTFDGWIHGSATQANGAAVAWLSKHSSGTVTMTKTGTGNLVLAGNQGYVANTIYDIHDGAVVFDTDPGQTISFGAPTGQNLSVKVRNSGVVDFNLAAGAPLWWNAAGTGTATYDPNATPRTGPAGAAPTSGSVLALELIAGGTARVATGKTANTKSLAVSSGIGNVNTEGTGTLKVTGSGSTISLAAGTTLHKTGAGTLWIDAGVMQSHGSGAAIVAAGSGGLVQLDSNGGPNLSLTVQAGTARFGAAQSLAALNVGAMGKLEIDVGDGSPAHSATQAILAGTLDVDYVGPGSPSSTDVFTLLNYSSRNGHFSQLTGEGAAWSAHYGSTAARGIVNQWQAPANLAGDFVVPTGSSAIVTGAWGWEGLLVKRGAGELLLNLNDNFSTGPNAALAIVAGKVTLMENGQQTLVLAGLTFGDLGELSGMSELNGELGFYSTVQTVPEPAGYLLASVAGGIAWCVRSRRNRINKKQGCNGHGHR